jgi:hypothetical protein
MRHKRTRDEAPAWLFVRQRAFLLKFHRIVLAACVCALLSACAHLVTISYPPEAVIHPTFNQRFTTWEGERVQVALATSLRGEALTYLSQYDQVLLANLVRQRGLHHEYEVAGKGTPLVVYCKNPVVTPREKHYPKSGIVLGVTAVKEDRPGKEPLLKMYDTLDPSVVRCARGANPIAVNYTAALAVLLSHSRKVATSSASAFLRPEEKIVPAGHTVFSDEAAVIEIKRILEENLTRSSHRKEVALRLQSSS